jgi:hypothetical protein
MPLDVIHSQETAADRFEFWKRFPGLIWSNSKAGDSAYIRAALLRPRFETLLSIALEFGLARLEAEWEVLTAEPETATLRAIPSVQRILGNIRKGFALAEA